jgi:signal transduction histidine kinase
MAITDATLLVVEDEKAIIKVIDSGVGIPQEKLDKLFNLHDKKSTYGTSGEKGLGLGLQLVYEFVEMNKGTIEVSSKEGEGTVFSFKLPLFNTLEEHALTVG